MQLGRWGIGVLLAAAWLAAAPAHAQPRGPLGSALGGAGLGSSASASGLGRASLSASRPVETVTFDNHVGPETSAGSLGSSGISSAMGSSTTRAPLLTRSATGWTSRGGLNYARTGDRDNRVRSVVAHTSDSPDTNHVWGVFEGGGHAAIETIDEAWRRAQTGGPGVQIADQPGGTRVITVDMGRRVGFAGGQGGAARGNPAATAVRLVVTGQNNLVAAYPMENRGRLFEPSRNMGARPMSAAPGFGEHSAIPTTTVNPIAGAGAGSAISEAGARGPLLSRTATGWMSRGGLAYTRQGDRSNRVRTVLGHTEDSATTSSPWGVFEGGGHAALDTVDEAWRRAQEGGPGVHVTEQRGNRVITVDMGRRVGYVGGQAGAQRGNPAATSVRLVVSGRNELVTAYPAESRVGALTRSSSGPLGGGSNLTATPHELPSGGAVPSTHVVGVEPAVRGGASSGSGPLLARSATGWTSRAGLAYARTSPQNNRVRTVVSHAEDAPDSPTPWGVFEGGGHGAIETVDDAWRRAQQGGPGVQVSEQRGNRVYTVEMGRRVGYVGGQVGAQRGNPTATRVRLVVSGDNEIVTAYPMESREGPSGGGMGRGWTVGDSEATRLPRTPTTTGMRTQSLTPGSGPRGALVYGQSGTGRERTGYVTAHSENRADTEHPWGVFDGGGEHALGVVDEAWRRAQEGGAGVHESSDRGNRVFTVDLGRRVGYVGGRPGAARGNPGANFVRIVVRDNNEVVSAYPVESADRGGLGIGSGMGGSSDVLNGSRPPETAASRAALQRWQQTYRATAAQQRQASEYNVEHPPAARTDDEIRQELVTRLATGPNASTRGVVPSAAANVRLGIPSPAGRDNPNDYLLARRDVVISYNRDMREPNWTAWHLDASDMGEVERQDAFRPDPTLPRDWTQATTDDYRGTGYHRGHMLRSGERTSTAGANRRTYVFSNIVPQARNNNVGPWNGLENYYRDLVRDGDGREVYVMAGPIFARGREPQRIGQNGVAVPNATWKIAVVLERGQTMADVGESTRVVSVIVPNSNRDVRMEDHWADYRVTPADIEHATGLRFFSNLPGNVASALRNQLDSTPVAYVPPAHH